jgi:hypothetical protein
MSVYSSRQKREFIFIQDFVQFVGDELVFMCQLQGSCTKILLQLLAYFEIT